MNLLCTTFMMMVALAFISVNDRVEAVDITKIIQGTVQEIKNNSISIIEDTDGKEVKTAIDSNTVYDSVQKLTDLKVGDRVQIDYKTNLNKRTAITITKIEAGGEDSV
jgi:Domain of unknown function (DUF5666)